jgi:signal transduction histidine kinase
MQQLEQATGLCGAERKRVEAVVETLATLRSEGENLAEVAHDARNMVTALALYCDLLEEPGVLGTPFLHYGNELRLVATASRRLVERLVALDTLHGAGADFSVGSVRELGRLPAKTAPVDDVSSGDRLRQSPSWDLRPAEPIDNLATELLANRNLLAALAGPSIALTADAEGGALPVWLTGEDLTRMLVNLVKNAAEAMPTGGKIQLGLHEFHAGANAAPWLVLTIEDCGPGIPQKALEKIFESGYTSRLNGASLNGGWPATHRGLGLAITRSIVEGAGGRIHAVNRTPSGARFKIELPVRSR